MVDNVKVIACILVVLGHIFQSMTKAGIAPAGNVYEWFDTAICYFHVPLFFILSSSYAGLIFAAWLMKKTKRLEFFLYPNKILKR